MAVAFLAAAGGYLLRDSQELTQTWSHCVDAAEGYDVQYPSGWHAGSGRFACLFFDPEPFEVPENTDFSGTALEVQLPEVSFDEALAGLIDTRFAETISREQVTVSGRRAFRLELVATGEGLFDRGTQTYGYLIDRGEERPLLVQTTARRGEPLRHRPVVDHAASTLRLFDVAAEQVAVLPEPVAETHRAILLAAEQGDVEQLAALAGPEDFSFTFGGPVEGGPAAYWRELEERGERPLENLAEILRLPYTLSNGVYVWPFAFDKTPEELTEYERELLAPLEFTFAGESYLGWRAGIDPNGRWLFFVAGD